MEGEAALPRRVNLVYDGWTLIEECGMGGEVQTRYIQGLGTDEPIAMIRTGLGAMFYHQDGLGSVMALTKEDGSISERYLYDVFGKATVLDSSGAIQSNSVIGNRFLYTGREWIAAADLYDYRNRVYMPQLGRFFQSDPIRFEGGDINIYRYVGNGVFRWVDPSGLCASEKTSIIAAAQEWNQKSPGWSYNNQCGEQSANLVLHVLVTVQPKYWKGESVGGSALIGNHQVAEFSPLNSSADEAGAKSFILDGFKGPFGFNSKGGVTEMTPEDFRKSYPNRHRGGATPVR